jgi:hypothetical protein
LIAAMGFRGERERLERMWAGIVRRGYRAQNGDLIGPDTLNLIARARQRLPEPIGDYQLIGAAAVRIAQAAGHKDDVGDDLNLVITLLAAALRDPTRSSSEALNLYAKGRPVSYGSFLASYRAVYGIDYNASPNTVVDRMERGIAAGWRVECPPVLGALRWYFRAESGGNPQLAELYAPIVEQWFT